MRLSFAPLEGLTDAVYRRAHAAVFGGADRYYTPFFSPTADGLSRRDLVALTESAEEPALVPQLLSKRAGDVLAAADQLAALGYAEINLNLGCPSGTVTAKGRGAGFLRDPDALDAFFDELFSALAVRHPTLRLSVKTRVGYASPDELPALLTVYNRYPIAELTVHPRLRADMYRGHPRAPLFAYVLENSRAPVCYNGDVFAPGDYRSLQEAYPTLRAVMCGRGAVADPALFLSCRGTALTPGEKTARLREMHDRILAENCRRMGEGRPLLCRMADLWNYQIFLFADSQSAASRIRQARNLAEYRAAVATLFREVPLRPGGHYLPRG